MRFDRPGNILEEFTRNGYRCLVTRGALRGYRHGYVILPATHPWATDLPVQCALDAAGFDVEWTAPYRDQHCIGFAADHVTVTPDVSIAGKEHMIDAIVEPAIHGMADAAVTHQQVREGVERLADAASKAEW